MEQIQTDSSLTDEQIRLVDEEVRSAIVAGDLDAQARELATAALFALIMANQGKKNRTEGLLFTLERTEC